VALTACDPGGPTPAAEAREAREAPAISVPGLDLLQPGEAERMAAALHIEHLGQLPRYELDISVSDVEGRYEGQGRLHWTNTTGQPQSLLPLLLHPNAPAEGGARDSGTLAISALSCSQGPACSWSQPSPTVVQVQLAAPVAPGELVTIDLGFGGRLRRLSSAANDVFSQSLGSMGSLAAPVGVADYGLLGEGDGLLTAASAYPMLAPFVDGEPAVDTPGAVGDLAWNQVAVFDVRVVSPTGLDVVSNLVDAAPEPLSAEAQLTRCQGAGVRDLVLVGSREWAHEEQRVGPVTLRSWFLERDREAGVSALATAALSLQTYSELLGAYPYRELDVVEASLVGGAGGVEFSGLVLIAGFLYRDPASSQSSLAGLFQIWSSLGAGGMPPELTDMLEGQRRFVVAHELAHQWVPGLVGTNSQQDAILDEALAQYLAGRVSEKALGPEAGVVQRDSNTLLNYALYRMLGGVDGVARRPTTSFAGTLEYGALVYGKAPYLYNALEQRHGRQGLDRALNCAVQEHAWGLVDTDGWLASLERHGASQAGGAAARWWQQAHGDEDLGVDADGELAMRLMFGEDMAAMMEQSFAITGMSFGDLMRLVAGGTPVSTPYQPGMLSPEEMLRLLEGEGR